MLRNLRHILEEGEIELGDKEAKPRRILETLLRTSHVSLEASEKL